MIPTVQERKKNVHVFMNYYPYLCRLQNTIPNPNVKIDSSNKSLDFVGDRLKFDDWKPVFEALSNDRTLHIISIRSRHLNAKVLEETETESQVRQNSPKSTPLFTGYILTKLAEALSKCLTDSSALTGLVLEKIPLTCCVMVSLNQGLQTTQSLQHLSLPYTQLGDDQCAGLCHALRNRPTLVWLNLTGCGLSEKGVAMLCNLLKFQKLNRYGESWKQSLRCRPVNANNMPGLRRLTLNHNSIGDAGVKIFADSLIDDLWLKALDLQHCGITVEGAEILLNLVRENHFLSVVDVRGNLQIPNSIVAAIVQQLAENNGDTIPEFQWLKEESVGNSKSSCRSVSGTLGSRSTQRLLSSTTLSSSTSNRRVCALPSKIRFAQPSFPGSRTRSASAKRTSAEKNILQVPWNWNNPEIKRRNSDQLVRRHSKTNQEILSELQVVKKQLQEVTIQLDGEKRRRARIEEELGKYKDVFGILEGLSTVNKPMLQSILGQLFKQCANQQKGNSSEPQSDKVDEPERVSVKRQDSIESIVHSINWKSHPEGKLQEFEPPSVCSPQSKSNSEDVPSKARLIFESLLSS